MILKLALSVVLLCVFVYGCMEPYVNRPWFDNTPSKTQAMSIVVGFVFFNIAAATAIWSLLP